MPLVYATVDDAAAALPPDVTAPKNLEQLVRLASSLVRRATRACVYDVTPAGAPSDSDVAAAFRDATVAQVTHWAVNGIDPTQGAQAVYGAMQGASLLSASYTQVDPAKAAEAKTATMTGLVFEAWVALEDVALLYGQQPREGAW